MSYKLPAVLEELFADRVYSELPFETDARPTEVPGSLELADALCELMQARIALGAAEKNVPGYTGHLQDKDYYQQEQDVYNRAADKFALAVKAVLNG